ncbi:kinase/pyrophosphorylase [candidate division KSB1 bacterium]|nr:kinase/pyrophosphorylase [candidate division KSB1 bacterium]
MRNIFIVSDGTGNTAEQAVRAALTQFADQEVEILKKPNIRTIEQAKDVIEEASKAEGFIVHTVVSDQLRRTIEETGKLYNVETIDLMGPLLAQFSLLFDILPFGKPGLFRELNISYFKRIETMEYAIRHDDGNRVSELDKAEIVLVGVSRTFKTPLSIYLAFKGWMVANIPIILNISPPDELFKLEPEKVFCLTTNANKLAILRQARDEHLGGTTGSYANLNHVTQELKYAQKIFSRQPKWSSIDVTNKPIEEIASEIVAMIRKKTTKDINRFE